MKTVRATKVGFYGSLRIPGQHGDVFEVEDDDYGSWFEEVDQADDSVPEPPKRGKGRKKAAQNEGGSATIDEEER